MYYGALCGWVRNNRTEGHPKNWTRVGEESDFHVAEQKTSSGCVCASEVQAGDHLASQRCASKTVFLKILPQYNPKNIFGEHLLILVLGIFSFNHVPFADFKKDELMDNAAAAHEAVTRCFLGEFSYSP